MKAVAFAVALLSVFAAGLVVGHQSATSPTHADCTRWAESQPGYSGNAVDNILHRDSLIRECMAR